MGKHVFISYSHMQGEWVSMNLIPCLRAGGAEVLLASKRINASKKVTAPTEETLGAADLNLVVLTPDYLASVDCMQELKRLVALAQPPQSKSIVMIKRGECDFPEAFEDVIHIDLIDDRATQQWNSLLRICEADLGSTAPSWLNARDTSVHCLQRGNSVNLVVEPGTKWFELIVHMKEDFLPSLGIVDLQDDATFTRRGLIAQMLNACGLATPVPPEPEDLVTFTRELEKRPSAVSIALIHFEMVAHRGNYDVDLFAALRFLMVEKQKLILLILSHAPFITFLPPDDPLSTITNLMTTELLGSK